MPMTSALPFAAAISPIAARRARNEDEHGEHSCRRQAGPHQPMRRMVNPAPHRRHAATQARDQHHPEVAKLNGPCGGYDHHQRGHGRWPDDRRMRHEGAHGCQREAQREAAHVAP